MQIEIDQNSGCCFGVARAIRLAEQELSKGVPLFCLGDIVHNSNEMQRLEKMGLHTIDHEQFEQLKNVKVLLRAHGEPPETYEIAKRNNIEIIDASCPVVLNLQKMIKQEFLKQTLVCKVTDNVEHSTRTSQIVIFGRRGHAEVNGLLGQTDGKAIVIENINEVALLDPKCDTVLFSQTTKSIEEFHKVCNAIENRLQAGVKFQCYDTICRQVSNRIDDIREFARRHDIILFQADQKSSNGKMLFNECLKVNPKSFFISSPEQIDKTLIDQQLSIGICGATSTPKWQMEALANFLR